MDWSALWILTLLCFGMLVYGLLVPGRFYHFPFFAAGIFLSFILPQLPGLANSRFISDEALTKTLLFSTLCLAMCGIGWRYGMRARPMKDHVYSEDHLLKAAAVLSVIGAYFFYKFGHLPDDLRLKGQLTGLPVAYLFFARLLTYGLAIALVCYARRSSPLALGIILFDTIFYLDRIVIAGRRGETAEFCLMIALAFWFQRRWVVPRIAVVAGLFFAIVGMLGAAEYRQATYYGATRDWSAVADINLAENWNRLLREGGPEMTNALIAINYIDETHEFDYGIEHWNSMVFTFVPAQIFGPEFKKSLMIPQDSMFGRYTPGVGETPTGMADAFASFWWFGCLKFFLVAYLMARLYMSAMKGNTTAQTIYMLSAVQSILVITHFTNEIVIAWVHMAIFLGPALYYARIPNAPFSKFAVNPGG
ncbi:hypothetical protein [Phyllobacterium pellucidum]|uniref:hypothetical protein n=1 Tax=Phyllobacterium pellucidum TaxID=2740464 RepID=UPI001D153E5E|nr:hypothetical protein [Phyllobacterium sp. T1018]UGY10501.1 hypothetical protein LLE51_004770 [Phyllobacterium sp. T1018]